MESNFTPLNIDEFFDKRSSHKTISDIVLFLMGVVTASVLLLLLYGLLRNQSINSIP